MTISISGLERFKQERDMLQLGLQGLEHSSSPEGKLLGELLKGILPDLEQNEPAEWRLTAALVKAIVERYDQIILCSEEGKPFIANSFGNAPELFVALDLPWYTVSMIPFLPTAELYIPDEIDEAERLGMATDMCTLFRLGISNVELGRVPKPTAFVGILSPCDGAGMFHQAIAHNKDWRNIPFFCTDLPYVGREHAIDFHALELQQMAAFLEEHTGRRLDVERLREVIKESNKQYQLWAEYNELRRAVPCPHSAAKGAQAWMVAQNFLVGDPKGTEWFCSLVEITEQRIKEGKGNVPDERIRLLWSQIPAVWLSELADWLREEWKACIVMDMIGYTPYTPIDTSSLESMFRGLAKRNLCDLPMVRLDRGTTDILLSDIRRIVKDYRIDCVVWPQNVGHKGGAASMGIMRELCREQGVPFLVLCLDLFNGRYIPISEVKSRFSEFFTATGLG